MCADKDQETNVMKKIKNFLLSAILITSFLSIIPIDYFRPILVSENENQIISSFFA